MAEGRADIQELFKGGVADPQNGAGTPVDAIEKSFGGCPRRRAGSLRQWRVGAQDEHLKARRFGGQLLAGQGAQIAFRAADDESAAGRACRLPPADGIETQADQFPAGLVEQMVGRAAGAEDAVTGPDQEAAVMAVLHEKLKKRLGVRGDRKIQVQPSVRRRADTA